MKKRLNKKGISPLVATVLLIGFTLALAVVIWMWAGGFLEERAQKAGKIANVEISCATEVGFSVVNACKGANEVKLTIENRKNIPLVGFTIRLEDGDNFEVKSIIQEIGKLEVGQFTAETELSPQSIMLIPQISVGPDEEASCPKSSVRIDNLQQC